MTNTHSSAHGSWSVWARTLFVIASFAVIAAACTPEAVEPTTTTSAPTSTAPAVTTTTFGGPQYTHGGSIIVGVDHEPATLNPFIPAGDDPLVTLIGQAYFTGVQEVDGFTLELIPEVVTELPTLGNGGVVINDNGTMTVRYEIVEEAVWSDGVPISGADFQFTLDTIMDPMNRARRTVYEDIVATEFLEKTFEYTLAAPTVRYETLFGTLIPQHDVEGSDFVADWNDRPWVSGGAFVFENWEEGFDLTVVRNDNYWRTDPETRQSLPYLDEVAFRFIPETTDLIGAFKTRELDVLQPPQSSQTIETVKTIEILQALETDGAVVEVQSGPVWEHVNFQFGPGRLDRNENSCNDLLEMRLAIARTIDRSALTDDLLSGQVEPLQSYVAAFTPRLSNNSWEQYSVDTAAAARSYAQAVAKAGKECSVVFSTTNNRDTRVMMSEMFVDMFAASGIPYENVLEDGQLFFGTTVNTGEWDLGEWAWQGSPGFAGLVRIHNVWDPAAPPPEGSNYYRWGTIDSSVVDESTVRFGEILADMTNTVDPGRLEELISEAEAVLAENLVLIPLFSRPSASAYWADAIGNLKHNTSSAGLTWNIDRWYRKGLAG
ncbi:MAG: ABC transporter substrate-binding protein [Actinomycetia bacterium]|nr:ABC transporter substrate-binding protein [Actinomycetes bacterium]